METTRIEELSIKMSRIGLGTWSIGGWMWGGTEKRDALNTVRTAIDSGITLIDTAPTYGQGAAEEIIGEVLREDGGRENLVISTKAGLETKDSSVVRNCSPERLLRELPASLRRLNTDYVDIYQIHWPDPLQPIHETAEIMQRFFKEGMIRAIGVSNFSAEQMEVFQEVAPLHVTQSPYNIFEREIEDEIFPYAKVNGIAIVAYGALCRGLLSGKVRPDSVYGPGDIRALDTKFRPPRRAHYLEAVRRLDQYAQERYGKRVIHLAVRWILDRGIPAALWGARHPSQLQALNGVLGWRLDRPAMVRINSIVDECVSEPIGAEFMAPPSRM